MPAKPSLAERVQRLEQQLGRLGFELARAHHYRDSDPGAALNKARVILERIVRDQFERRVGEPPGTRSLNQLLTHQEFRRAIKPRVLAWMRTIQDLGNLGCHGHTVVGDDARLSLDALCSLVDWYLADTEPPQSAEPAEAGPSASAAAPVSPSPPPRAASPLLPPAASPASPASPAPRSTEPSPSTAGSEPERHARQPVSTPSARPPARRSRLKGVLIAAVAAVALLWVAVGGLLLLPRTARWREHIELPRQMKTLERKGHAHLSYALRRRLGHAKETFHLTTEQGLSAADAVLAVVDRLPRTSPQLAQLMPQTAFELARSVGQRDVSAVEAERMAAILVDFMVQQQLGNRAGFDWDVSVLIGRKFAARNDAGKPVTRPVYAKDWAANGVPDLKSAARLRAYLERTLRLPYFAKTYRPGEGAG